MSTYPRPTAREALPREKVLRRDRRDCSATACALRIGEVICNQLHQTIAKGTTLRQAVLAALKREGFRDCSVKVISGEIHAFIGSIRNRLHGHVIVPIRKKIVRYYRGYAMPRGYWNHCD